MLYAMLRSINGALKEYRLTSLCAIVLPIVIVAWLCAAGLPAALAWVSAHGWLVGTLTALVLLSSVWVVPLTTHVVCAGHRAAYVTWALGQLREPTRAGQLTGITALERMAQMFPADHWTVMEVLTAYVRMHAPWPPQPITPPVGASFPSARCRSDVCPPVSSPAPEIQAALLVIGRRDRSSEAEEQVLDLRQVDFRGADLPGAHFEGADLKYSHLEGAKLTAAYLSQALLSETHLEGANLLEARLEGAYLGKARLEQANLQGAHLERAILRGASLQRTDLTGAHLERADLTGADLAETLLGAAHLEGADLTAALHLTWEQIAAAIIDTTTCLPPHLVTQLAEQRQLTDDEGRDETLEWSPLLGS